MEKMELHNSYHTCTWACCTRIRGWWACRVRWWNRRWWTPAPRCKLAPVTEWRIVCWCACAIRVGCAFNGRLCGWALYWAYVAGWVPLVGDDDEQQDQEVRSDGVKHLKYPWHHYDRVIFVHHLYWRPHVHKVSDQVDSYFHKTACPKYKHVYIWARRSPTQTRWRTATRIVGVVSCPCGGGEGWCCSGWWRWSTRWGGWRIRIMWRSSTGPPPRSCTSGCVGRWAATEIARVRLREGVGLNTCRIVIILYIQYYNKFYIINIIHPQN